MDRNAIRAALVELLEENVGEAYPDLADGDDLRGGLGLDSVDLLSVLIGLQGRFGVEIANAEFAGLHLVGDLLDNLECKLNARGHGLPPEIQPKAA
jgi:acyl carrier protein